MIFIVIGIDIDGVVNDLGLFHIACGTKYCVQNNISYNIDPYKMDSTDIFRWSNDTDTVFWNKYYLQLLLHSYFVRPFVSEVTHSLTKAGHTIIFISARGDGDLPSKEKRSMFKITTEYLKRNRIHYSDLILSHDKVSIITSKCIDLMIEDNPCFFHKYSDYLAIPLLCFDTYYNADISGKNIIRVFSWYDILEKIHVIEREKNEH